MEMLEHYIKQAQYVQGVYALKAGDMTYECAASLAQAWHEQFGDSKVLIIVPSDEDLHYASTFDFCVALRLVKSGWKVTRAGSRDFYLQQDEQTGVIMEQILREGHDPTEYLADSEDLTAEDWVVYHDVESSLRDYQRNDFRPQIQLVDVDEYDNDEDDDE
ncbi:hypothetical protein SAMN02799624_05243 [Paenibacillus sp. UNC496MF]|uniref:hypothetical protein n=1 Tax=Paenibacillus sp. UNC496MF TaxID=1502753 RepID=UPI0008DF38C1|nr:hypothetical protein [Paenibacillus sp. UNC496MF]SFJ62750.1 hypothetical protein SAMN02799624_05243 [Paenibacillus sp. UNC496MF]